MGNTVNAFDFNDSLAVFLASAVSDGTYASLLSTLKFDEVGDEALASQIDGAGGQLWSNLADDYILATYPSFYRATKTWRVADATARDALGSDDGLAVNDIGYTEDTNSLWYVVSVDGASSSTWAALSAGAETLATTLVAGNATGGTNIVVTTGQAIEGQTNLALNPGGAGPDRVILDGLTWPGADGSIGQVLGTNGAGVLAFQSGGELAGSQGVPLDNLVAYVDIGDRQSYPGTGSTVTDIAGNLSAGTITGATYQDGALDFDAASGDLTFTKPAAVDDLFSGGGTLMVFFRAAGQGESAQGRLVDTTDGAAEGYSLYLSFELTGTTARAIFVREFDTTDGIWSTDDVDAVRTVKLDSWNSIAVVYDDANVANNPTFYLNGRQIASTETQTPAGSAVTDVGNPFIVGNRSADDRTFDGEIDAVLAWDAGSDPETIAKAHNVFSSRHGNATGAASTVSAGGDLFLYGGDYYGVGSDNGGGVNIVGGSSPNGNNSAEGGPINIKGGDGAGFSPLGAVNITAGTGGQETTASVFGGGTVNSSNSPATTLFRGSDNNNTGPGGDTIFRAGDAIAGSGNDAGGDLGIRSGQHRGGSVGGALTVRSGGPTDGTGGVTGDLYLTTRQAAITGDPNGAQGNTTTQSGDIEITTTPGATANVAGDILIEAGTTDSASSNDPGAVTIRAGSMSRASQNFVGGRDVLIEAGESAGTQGGRSGSVILNAGSQSNAGSVAGDTGGDVVLNPGTSVGAGRDGHVDASGAAAIIFPEYTVAGVPPATDHVNGVIIVSDETGGRTLATSDATNWRRVSDGAIIA